MSLRGADCATKQSPRLLADCITPLRCATPTGQRTLLVCCAIPSYDILVDRFADPPRRVSNPSYGILGVASLPLPYSDVLHEKYATLRDVSLRDPVELPKDWQSS
ncbi:MAG: hypothetical protein PVG14_14230 [Anaerolineales bacterium]